MLQPGVIDTFREAPGPECRDDEAKHPVVVCLLGGFRLLRRGEVVVLRRGGKTEAVLTCLGLASPQGVLRETLLWKPTSDNQMDGDVHLRQMPPLGQIPPRPVD